MLDTRDFFAEAVHAEANRYTIREVIGKGRYESARHVRKGRQMQGASPSARRKVQAVTPLSGDVT